MNETRAEKKLRKRTEASARQARYDQIPLEQRLKTAGAREFERIHRKIAAAEAVPAES